MSLNAAITGLRFFFEVTLSRSDAMAKMKPVYEPRKLPVVLSVGEVARLLDAPPNLKAKAALAVAYGTGLRASEVVHLKVGDIDRERKVIRVEQGKGRKDRYAMLSPKLHVLLRQCGQLPDLVPLRQPNSSSLGNLHQESDRHKCYYVSKQQSWFARPIG